MTESQNKMFEKIDDKLDRLLGEVSEIKQFMSAQQERNKIIDENKEKIERITDRVVSVERITEDYVEFKKDFKTTLWKILSPPLAAAGIALFLIVGIVLWAIS